MIFQTGISCRFRESQINQRPMDEMRFLKMLQNAYLTNIARESPIIIKTVVKALDDVQGTRDR